MPCVKCGLAVFNEPQHRKWCRCVSPLETGIWFQSAVSGLWYSNPRAAGDVSAVKIYGALFVQGHKLAALLEFMLAAARETKCLPDFVDCRPCAGNAHIIRSIRQAAAAEPAAQAAHALESFLRRAVGDTADWPVHIHVDNVADADGLAALLGALSNALTAWRKATAL